VKVSAPEFCCPSARFGLPNSKGILPLINVCEFVFFQREEETDISRNSDT
jgi:hypothetical protein